jgi:hypothetical protein
MMLLLLIFLDCGLATWLSWNSACIVICTVTAAAAAPQCGHSRSEHAWHTGHQCTRHGFLSACTAAAAAAAALQIGHNPSEHAWHTGHYYSNPSNRMWRILEAAGDIKFQLIASHYKAISCITLQYIALRCIACSTHNGVGTSLRSRDAHEGLCAMSCLHFAW